MSDASIFFPKSMFRGRMILTNLKGYEQKQSITICVVVFVDPRLLKTEDIHPPKTGISVHFSGSLV